MAICQLLLNYVIKRQSNSFRKKKHSRLTWWDEAEIRKVDTKVGLLFWCSSPLSHLFLLGYLLSMCVMENKYEWYVDFVDSYIAHTGTLVPSKMLTKREKWSIENKKITVLKRKNNLQPSINVKGKTLFSPLVPLSISSHSYITLFSYFDVP